MAQEARLTEDFREQIEYLADRAGEERARIADEVKPVKVRKPVRKFMIVGAVLAVIEIGLLGYFQYRYEQELSGAVEKVNPLLTAPTCEGERYRTAQALIQYSRAHGGGAPETLDALVPDYMLSRPVDPETRLPLQYRKLANGFRLECAKLK